MSGILLDNPVMKGLTLAKYRAPQRGGATLPAGLEIISADNHIGLKDDIWYEGFPEHLKDRAPRVVLEHGLWNIRAPGDTPFDQHNDVERKMFDIVESAEVPGNTDLEIRMQDLAVEGYQREIAFPQLMLRFLAHPNLEEREWIFRIYNQHLAKMQAQQPGKFYGVAIANYWDPSKARESIQEIKALGLKTFMLPQHPGKTKDGTDIYYPSPEFEPLWDAIEEAGLPVCFHIGEVGSAVGRNGWTTLVLERLGPFRRTFAQLVFGGILDRNPGIRVVFVEAGINWVPGTLQDAEMMYDSFTDLLDPKPALRPSEYWHRNCYAVFMADPVGMKLLDYIGADRIMWSADYPHNEGSFGYGWKAIEAVLDAVSERDARLILGDTARQVFDLG
jgi:predicted TIM-barrel fold metal-dependent hydrolase